MHLNKTGQNRKGSKAKREESPQMCEIGCFKLRIANRKLDSPLASQGIALQGQPKSSIPANICNRSVTTSTLKRRLELLEANNMIKSPRRRKTPSWTYQGQQNFLVKT